MNRDQQTIYYDLPESYKSPSTSNLSPSTSYWELKQANMALQPPQLTHESLSNLNHQDFRASPLDPNYDSAGSLMEPSVGPDVDVYRQQYSISRDGTKIFPSISPPYRYLTFFPFSSPEITSAQRLGNGVTTMVATTTQTQETITVGCSGESILWLSINLPSIDSLVLSGQDSDWLKRSKRWWVRMALEGS